MSQPKALKAALDAEGEEALELHKTKFAGRPAFEAVATQQVPLRDGTQAQAHSKAYFVPVKKDVLEVVFTTLDDGRQDPSVHTMIGSFKTLR
jgi:hypothetical protein